MSATRADGTIVPSSVTVLESRWFVEKEVNPDGSNHLARNEVNDVQTERGPELTVVVCSLNGERTLEGCLTSLVQQTATDRIEIIVVDDGSRDATPAIAVKHGVRLVTHAVNRGLSAARNSGIAAARAELIAFTDDDCVPNPDWAENIISAFSADSEAMGVGGEIDTVRSDSIVHRYLAANNPLKPLEISYAAGRGLFHRALLYVRGTSGVGVRRVYSLVGASMAFRAAALDEVGGFDSSIRFGGDDEDICTRVRTRYGLRALVVDPSVRVAHDFDDRWSDTLRRSFMYGVGNGREWAGAGGLPSVPPAPLLTVLAGVAALPISRRAVPVAMCAMPALLFRRSLIDAVRLRRLERTMWPGLALSQEVAANVGFLEGWRRSR